MDRVAGSAIFKVFGKARKFESIYPDSAKSDLIIINQCDNLRSTLISVAMDVSIS